MKIARAFLAILVVAVFALTGCKLFGPGDDGGDNGGDGTTPVATDLTFDLTGAKALAAGESSARKGSGAEDTFALVKILDDGSVEPVLDTTSGDFWFPEVMFIAKSPVAGKKDLYVALNGTFWTPGYDDPETGEWVDDKPVGSFMHIKEDGSVVWIDEGKEGQVQNNTWWGVDDYKPIDFDTLGNVYYVYKTWGSNGDVNVLYSYDPGEETATALTGEIEGFHYEQFQVDPSGGRLFVRGRYESSSTQAQFFYMYPVLDMAHPVSVYYSSRDNMWVRGFEISPSGEYVVLNGWNIRGMSGLIKAAISYDNTTITYTPLYASDTSSGDTDWFNPEYQEWVDWDGNRVRTGLFDRWVGHNYYVAMTTGIKVVYIGLETGGYSFWDHPDAAYHSQLYDWDNNEYTFTLGSDMWFSTNPDQPSATSDATSWNELNNTTHDGVFKLRRQIRNEETDQNEYQVVDAPQAVIDHFADPANRGIAVFLWNEHWHKDTDAGPALDAQAILDYLGTYYIQDIDFSYGGATTAIDGSFANALAAEPFTEEQIFGTSGDPWYFLKQHVVKAGTTDPATTFKEFRTDHNLPWLNFSDIGNLFFDDNGQLWGVLVSGWNSSVKPMPIKLLDASGDRDLQVVDAFATGDYNPVGFTVKGSHLYFRNGLLDAGGGESPYQQMLRFDFTQATDSITADDVQNCLANVDSNDTLQILDFSIDDEDTWLYFTALQGLTTVVGGKVRLDDGSFTFTPFDSELRLQNIQVY